MNQSCRVCGEVAAGYHFGAFTCEGCKSFFGRTYNNRSSIGECKNNNLCVINKKNRTSCKSCRLKKCFSVGMSKSGSRYGRRSNWFKIHCLLQDQGIMQQQHQNQQQQQQQLLNSQDDSQQALPQNLQLQLNNHHQDDQPQNLQHPQHHNSQQQQQQQQHNQQQQRLLQQHNQNLQQQLQQHNQSQHQQQAAAVAAQHLQQQQQQQQQASMVAAAAALAAASAAATGSSTQLSPDLGGIHHLMQSVSDNDPNQVSNLYPQIFAQLLYCYIAGQRSQ